MTAPNTSTTRKRRTSPRVVPATVDLPEPEPQQGEAGDTTQPGSSDAVADLEVIFPDPTMLEVAGIPASVRRLQTREVMAGVRVLVNEMGAGITELDLNALMITPEEGDDDAAAKLAAAQSSLMGFLLVATPNAADEILKLLASLVEPKDPSDAKTLAKIMENPPPGVTLDVVGAVFAQERDDFAALVGKVRPLLGYAQALQRTGKAGT